MLPPHIRRTGGPVPKFTDYHIWKALMVLNRVKPIGRKALAKHMGVGEGSARTVLNMFSEQGLISINKNGIMLTDAGTKIRNEMELECHAVAAGGLTIGEIDCAVRIPGSAGRITFGCEERDIAIKAGATGATTLVCSKGRLIFPGSDYPADAETDKMIRDAFAVVEDGDTFIIGTAGTYEIAETGAVTAAIVVLGGLCIRRALHDVLEPDSAPADILSLAFAVHNLVGGLPVCAKSRDNLGIRIENGAVIDNAYTGDMLEEAMSTGATIRRVAASGPYKGVKVTVTPVELDKRIVAAIGVADVRTERKV